MDPYIGEIRLFSFDRIPYGWVPCNGQLLAVNTNQALFSLLTNVYGGTSPSTFAVPNLNGKVIIGAGKSQAGTVYAPGATGGTESVVLTPANLPMHNHAVNAAGSYDTYVGTNALLGNPDVKTSATQTQSNTGTVNMYNTAQPNVILPQDTLLPNTSGGAGHENRMPYLSQCYCIAVMGMYPMRP